MDPFMLAAGIMTVLALLIIVWPIDTKKSMTIMIRCIRRMMKWIMED